MLSKFIVFACLLCIALAFDTLHVLPLTTNVADKFVVFTDSSIGEAIDYTMIDSGDCPDVSSGYTNFTPSDTRLELSFPSGFSANSFFLCIRKGTDAVEKVGITGDDSTAFSKNNVLLSYSYGDQFMELTGGLSNIAGKIFKVVSDSASFVVFSTTGSSATTTLINTIVSDDSDKFVIEFPIIYEDGDSYGNSFTYSLNDVSLPESPSIHFSRSIEIEGLSGGDEELIFASSDAIKDINLTTIDHKFLNYVPVSEEFPIYITATCMGNGDLPDSKDGYSCELGVSPTNTIATNLSGIACYANTCTLKVTEAAPLPILAGSLFSNKDGSSSFGENGTVAFVQVFYSIGSVGIASGKGMLFSRIPIGIRSPYSSGAKIGKNQVGFLSVKLNGDSSMAFNFDISGLSLKDADEKKIECVKFTKANASISNAKEYDTFYFKNECTEEVTATGVLGTVSGSHTAKLSADGDFSIVFTNSESDGVFANPEITIETDNIALPTVPVTFSADSDGKYMVYGLSSKSIVEVMSNPEKSSMTANKATLQIYAPGKYTICVFNEVTWMDMDKVFCKENINIEGTVAKPSKITFDAENEKMKVEFTPSLPGDDLPAFALFGDKILDNEYGYTSTFYNGSKAQESDSFLTFGGVPRGKNLNMYIGDRNGHHELAGTYTAWPSYGSANGEVSFNNKLTGRNIDMKVSFSNSMARSLEGVSFFVIIEGDSCPDKKDDKFKALEMVVGEYSVYFRVQSQISLKKTIICTIFEGDNVPLKVKTFEEVTIENTIASASFSDDRKLSVTLGQVIPAGVSGKYALIKDSADTKCPNYDASKYSYETPIGTTMKFAVDFGPSKLTEGEYLVCVSKGENVTTDGIKVNIAKPVTTGFSKNADGKLKVTWSDFPANIGGSTSIVITLPVGLRVRRGDDSVEVLTGANNAATVTIASGEKVFDIKEMFLGNVDAPVVITAGSLDITSWFTLKAMSDSLASLGMSLKLSTPPKPSSNSKFSVSVGGSTLLPVSATSVESVPVPPVPTETIAMFDSGADFEIKRRCEVPSYLKCVLSLTTSGVLTQAADSCTGNECTYTVTTNTTSLPETNMKVTTVDDKPVSPEDLNKVVVSALSGVTVINSQSVEVLASKYNVTFTIDDGSKKEMERTKPVEVVVSVDRPLDEGETVTLKNFSGSGVSFSPAEVKFTSTTALGAKLTMNVEGSDSKSTLKSITASISASATRYDKDTYSPNFVLFNEVTFLPGGDTGMTLMTKVLIGAGIFVVVAGVVVLIIVLVGGKKDKKKGINPKNERKVSSSDSSDSSAEMA